jgi:hypothetical protein
MFVSPLVELAVPVLCLFCPNLAIIWSFGALSIKPGMCLLSKKTKSGCRIEDILLMHLVFLILLQNLK